MKSKKTIIFFLIILILLVAGYFARPFFFQEIEVQTLTEEEVKDRMGTDASNFIPKFTEIQADYSHSTSDKSVTFTGSALIDIDGDGVEEIFVGGGGDSADALLKFDGEKFVNIAADVGIDNSGPTVGAVSIDADNDGDVDLFVARATGVFLYENQGGKFTEKKIEIQIDDRAAPFAIATTDLNGDGFVDLYISTFIKNKYFKSATFNDPNNLTANVLLMNDGSGSFEDVTSQSGIDFEQNTFVSAFVDLNNDDLPDFVAATNTDRVKVYKNLGDGKFESLGDLTDYGFWMGLAVADIDNDGDQDLFFSNSGNTLPESIARGDLTADQVFDSKWSLLRNDGDFKFTQVNTEKGVADFEFAWGADFADMNLDGREDLIVVENYVKWPAHKFNKLPARFLLQADDGKFLPIITLAGVENPHYGMTPLISDFNRDGYPDLVYINLKGPVKAFLNNGGVNHYLTVQMPDTAAALGARVTVKTGSGKVYSQQFISSTGLISDQSSQLYFGLGGNVFIESVEVHWLSGETELFEDVEIDAVFSVE